MRKGAILSIGTLLGAALAVNACNKGGKAGSDTSNQPAPPATQPAAETPAGDTKAGGTTASAKEKQKKDQIDAASGVMSPGALALASAINLLPPANPGALAVGALALTEGGEYDEDVQSAFFNPRDPAFDLKSTVDSIQCLLASTAYTNDALRTGTPYVAQVDMNDCFKQGGDSSSGPAPVNITVVSTGPDNLHVKAKFWFIDTSDSNPKYITIAAQVGDQVGDGAVNDPAYENYLHVQFQFHPVVGITPDLATNLGGGALRILKDRSAQKLKVKFYMDQGSDGSDRSHSQVGSFSALVSLDEGSRVTGGSVVVKDHSVEKYDGQTNTRDANVIAAFDSEHFLRRNVTEAANACLSVQNFNYNIYEYGLYSAETRAHIKADSGFPVKVTNADGSDDRCFVSYYGFWCPANKSPAADATITREDGSASHDTFTIKTAPGKLIRSTRTERSLAKDLGPFNQWSMSAQMMVEWRANLQAFVVTGTRPNQQGPSSGPPPDPTPVLGQADCPVSNGNFGQTVAWDGNCVLKLNPGFNQMQKDMSSDSTIFIANDAGTPTKAYDVVQMDVTATADELTLYCADNCLKADISAAEVAAQQQMNKGGGQQQGGQPQASAYSTSASIANPVVYTWDKVNARLVDKATGKPVGLAAGVAWPTRESDYAPGVNFWMGSMIASAGDLASAQALAAAAKEKADAAMQACQQQNGGGQQSGGQQGGGQQGGGQQGGGQQGGGQQGGDQGGGQQGGGQQGGGQQGGDQGGGQQGGDQGGGQQGGGQQGGDQGGGQGGGQQGGGQQGGGCGGAPSGPMGFQGLADVTYSYQMGQDAYNQSTMLIDSNGKAVSFDPPISLNYTHKQEFDAEGNTTSKSFGKLYSLQFMSGNLNGIPGVQGTDGYWHQVFSIKSGARDDEGKYLIAALGGDKYMKKVDDSKCSALNLDNLPEEASASDVVQSFFNNEPQPTGNLPVRVVDKEVMGL